MSNVPDHVFDILKKVDAQANLFEQERKRLSKILSEAGLPEDYLNALSWQTVRATFHANQAFKAANADTQSAKDVEAGGTVWKEPAVTATAETIACVHAVHEVVDTILKMINDLVLSKRYEEMDVSFDNILKELKRCSRCSALHAKLSDLKSSKEFKYIRAFCNTVKHTYSDIHQGQAVLIDLGRGQTEQGMQFGTFKYKENSYPELWAREIYLDYRGEMFRLVAEVLKEFSAHIQAP